MSEALLREAQTEPDLFLDALTIEATAAAPYDSLITETGHRQGALPYSSSS